MVKGKKSVERVRTVSKRREGEYVEALESRNKSDRASMDAVRVSAPSTSYASLEIERTQVIVTVFEQARASYEAACAKLGPRAEMPQHLVAFAHLAARADKALESIRKMFNETALKLRDRGSFEDGVFKVQFEKQTGRRNPAWKEEAIRRARLLAIAKGKKFNEKRFVERILEAAPKADDTYKPTIEVDDDRA